MNFYSVSGDGRVTNWTIVKTALWYTDTLNITFSKTLHNFSEEDTKTNLRDGGRCVAFNPNDDTMFLVGTDEGLIYKCTTEYSSRFLETYPAHNTPIYNIAWNPYVPSIFLTCAAEWMIKIWDHNSTLVHYTVFENHRKSLIKLCERSELRLHFEWTKMQKKKSILSPKIHVKNQMNF